MRFRSNAHTHTPYCDGLSSIEEIIAAAKGLGFVSLGFSGHGDQGFDPSYSMMDGRQEAYVSVLRALARDSLARKEFPRLWVGVEEDSLTPAAQQAVHRRTLDYVIGSTHYLEKDYQGVPIAVDGDPLALATYIQETMDGDGLAMAKRYFSLLTEGVLRSKPDIIGHFDLVRKYALSHGLFDPQSPVYRRMALEALEKAFSCGGVLEVNTGAMARGVMDCPYPSQELLGAWRELGGSVTITSDCHDASKLDYGFDLAMRLLLKLGYRQVWRLGAGDVLWEEERVAALRG